MKNVKFNDQMERFHQIKASNQAQITHYLKPEELRTVNKNDTMGFNMIIGIIGLLVSVGTVFGIVPLGILWFLEKVHVINDVDVFITSGGTVDLVIILIFILSLIIGSALLAHSSVESDKEYLDLLKQQEKRKCWAQRKCRAYVHKKAREEGIDLSLLLCELRKSKQIARKLS